MSLFAIAWFALAARIPPPEPRVHDLYDWCAVAPLVLAGESRGDDGKWHLFLVEEVLRGEPSLRGASIRVRLARANRDRDRTLHRAALHLTEGDSYLLLLEPSTRAGGTAAHAYEIVRGLEGVRELPPEGRSAVLGAMGKLIEVQELASDPRTWQRMGELLDETNPLVIETALDQFLKFHRAEPANLTSLVPLLDHPASALRLRAARVIGQVLHEHAEQEIPDATLLRAELIARARRDGEVAVRMAAAEALDGFGDDRVLDVLREIAASDPDQHVRYAAQKLIYERERKRGARAGVPN
jgi:hypothetical protein